MAQIQPDLSPGVHSIPKPGLEAAITIHQSNQVVDLSKFVLHGASTSAQENYTGVGLLLDHCANLTLRGGTIQGYKINVLLRDCKNVRLEGMKCDRSHAIAIQTILGQPINQFLNLRDIDEWTGYGAGIWLHRCVDCHVSRCSAHHAMNGAILVDCNRCTVYDCDWSYNSAWGLGLWNSSENRILWNHIDFCNRPWSGGWGGDAADLVVVSNSNKNVIVGNSLTHGGDGFFLADRVQGGWNDSTKKFEFQDNCNNNLIWENDGSWASANAFEGTFSQGNSYGKNLANRSSYGFWLGYSFDSVVVKNQVNLNDHDGIAIEHGSNNRLIENSLDGDGEAAIHLWSEKGEKDDDRPSIDNLVYWNQVENCGAPYNLRGSSKTHLYKPKGESPTEPLESAQWIVPPEIKAAERLKPIGWKSYAESGGPTGQAWIQAGRYAPTPFINFGAAYVNSTTYKLWFARVPNDLTKPDWLTLKPGANPHYLTATADLKGPEIGKDESAPVGFSIPSSRGSTQHQMLLKFRTGAWDCKWFSWKGLDYDDHRKWLYLFDSPPLATQNLPTLNADYSGKSPVPGVVPTDHFALLATRSFLFDSGIYRFNTTSDDGIRLFVDGREVISRWNHHGSTADTAEVSLTKGPHELRVEYCQEDGAAQLKVDWTEIKRVIRLKF